MTAPTTVSPNLTRHTLRSDLRRTGSRLGVLTLVVATLLTCTARGDDRTASSIAEFVENKDRWNRLVGRPLRLEGRYTVFSTSDLRFANCDLRFVLTRTFRRPPASTRNVEVAGQLVRNDGRLEFHVSDLKPRESDLEQLKLKRALANSSNAESIYEVADWARQRGTFYNDNDLKSEADRLYREGLTIAHEHLQPGDIDGLRELATTASKVGVDAGVALRYLHQADRLVWDAARAETKQDYRPVLGLIRRDLPGAGTPLPTERLASIRKNYQKAPLAVYEVADAPTRRLLDRAFYLEVALADILLSADPSGKNGDQIASRIEHDLPELKSLADDHRQRELDYLTARVTRLTRSQMVDLSERYQQRGQTRQSRGVIRDWLKAQEPRAAAAGPTDLMELGDEYINLLQDERGAGRMYKQAYQLNPQLASARDWLSGHGYELRGREWSKPGESDENMADSELDAAIAEGRVQVGMSGAQVLKTLGTQPSSAIRIASSGEVAELWVFDDYGITVRLQRRSSSPSASVVEIRTVD